MGRIDRGGGDVGEPVRSPPGAARPYVYLPKHSAVPPRRAAWRTNEAQLRCACGIRPVVR
jgi:hypothetical protein